MQFVTGTLTALTDLMKAHAVRDGIFITFGSDQGWTGKTQPGLTRLVKTGLNHKEKLTKVGKIVFLLTFLLVF